MKPLTAIREEFPTYDICVKKIEEYETAIKEMEQRDEKDPRIESYKELKAEVERLVKFFNKSKDKIGEFESRYQDVLAELQALTPLTRETKTERQSSLRKVAELTAKLAKTSEVLAIFGDDGGDRYFKNIRGTTGQSVRDLVGDFYGKGTGAKESKEHELQIAPTESEKKLAAHYSGKNRAELAAFFDSKEYKELKAEFNTIKTGDETADVFLKTEFAKLASLETPEERKKLVQAMRAFRYGLHRPNGPLDDNIVNALMEGGRNKRQVQNPTWVTDALKGKSQHESMNLSMQAYDLQARYRMAKASDGVGDSPDLNHAMPSYVIWKLYRENKLAEFGIDDRKFFEMVGMNQYNGVYFNFANMDWMRNGQIQWIKDIKDKDKFIALVKAESRSVASDLVPTVNAVAAEADARDEVVSGGKYRHLHLPKLLNHEYGLRRDTMHGAIESTESDAGVLNEEGRRIYEENFGKKVEEVKKEGEMQEKRKKADELMRVMERGETGEEIVLDTLLVGGKMDLSSPRAVMMLLDTVNPGLYVLDRKAESLKKLMESLEELLKNDTVLQQEIDEYSRKIEETKKGFFLTKSRMSAALAPIKALIEENKNKQRENRDELRRLGKQYVRQVKAPLEAGIDADTMDLNEDTLAQLRALHEQTLEECRKLVAMYDERITEYRAMVAEIVDSQNLSKLQRMKMHQARIKGIDPGLRAKYGSEKRGK